MTHCLLADISIHEPFWLITARLIVTVHHWW